MRSRLATLLGAAVLAFAVMAPSANSAVEMVRCVPSASSFQIGPTIAGHAFLTCTHVVKISVRACLKSRPLFGPVVWRSHGCRQGPETVGRFTSATSPPAACTRRARVYVTVAYGIMVTNIASAVSRKGVPSIPRTYRCPST